MRNSDANTLCDRKELQESQVGRIEDEPFDQVDLHDDLTKMSGKIAITQRKEYTEHQNLGH